MILYYVKTRYTNYLCSDFIEYFLIDCDHLRSVERRTENYGDVSEKSGWVTSEPIPHETLESLYKQWQRARKLNRILK